MRFKNYVNENYKKALNIGEPEVGSKYSDDAVQRRITTIEAGIKDANKLPDDEHKEGILADLEDKLDKWSNVDQETEAPKAPAPPEGEEGEEEAAGEEEADAEAEEDADAKDQEDKEKEKEDKEIEKDDKAVEKDEEKEKEREKKEREREKQREKSQKKESIRMNFKEYLEEKKFSSGDKVKVINKDDEYYGKKGVVHKVKKSAQTVKLDGIGKQSIVSFNDDELKKLNEMQRIRMSGNDTFDGATIKCTKCGAAIITKGEPMTPLYFKDKKDKPYCSKCGS